MENLFENDYLIINRNYTLDYLEVIGKNRLDLVPDFEQSMKTIRYYVYYTHATRIVFSVIDYVYAGNEDYMAKHFIPELGHLGVKHLAVITGESVDSKAYFEEINNYLSTAKQQYNIEMKLFNTIQDGIHWIEKQ